MQNKYKKNTKASLLLCFIVFYCGLLPKSVWVWAYSVQIPSYMPLRLTMQMHRQRAGSISRSLGVLCLLFASIAVRGQCRRKMNVVEVSKPDDSACVHIAFRQSQRLYKLPVQTRHYQRFLRRLKNSAEGKTLVIIDRDREESDIITRVGRAKTR